MFNKIFLLIPFIMFFCYASEFTFLNDTVGDYNVIGNTYPKRTYINNLTSDSLIIDSLALIIDTIKFPKYQVHWGVIINQVPILYMFGNICINGYWWGDYFSIADYKKKYPTICMKGDDSIQIEGFRIDKVLYMPTLFSDNRDSIVPITIGIIFFSKGFSDTLYLNGKYNYDKQITSGIINEYKPYKTMKSNYNSFYFNCFGRSLNACHTFLLGAGVYMNSSTNKVIKIKTTKLPQK